jgi:XTP/dITP diphosphohydrolase
MSIKSPPFEKLVIASHNKGKLREIDALIAPFGIAALSAGDLGVGEPEETETTFIGNALLKARASCLATGLPALADDSGIEVTALNGDPGVYTANWAEQTPGGPRDFYVAMARVEAAIAKTGSLDRRARFVCVLALVRPDGSEQVFEGEVWGTLTQTPRGTRGFGFDPVFIPNGHDITFGEMDPEVKHAMSHRADAFAKFVSAILT